MPGYDYDDGYTGFRRLLNPRDPKLRIALIVLLCIAAIALLWWSVSQFVVVGDEQRIGGELHVTCMECDAESIVTKAKLREKIDKDDPGKQVFADCTKCGASDCCVVMARCPKCGKYFLSELRKALYEAAQNGETINKAAYAAGCPNCPADGGD